MSIFVAAIDGFFPSRSLVWKYGLCWGGGVTSRSFCRLGIGGGGDVYGWWGFSRTSKIFFGCTVCSSCKWILMEKSVYV